MNIKEYWHDVDLRLEQLVENGYVKLLYDAFPSFNFSISALIEHGLLVS